MCRLDDGFDTARIVEGTDGVDAPKKGPMEKLRVVFKGYGKAFQARSGGVVVSAEDVVSALVKADGCLEWRCCGAPSANRSEFGFRGRYGRC